MFGNPADGGFLKPPDPEKTFTLKTAEIRCVSRPAWNLYWDIEVILGIAKVHSKTLK